MLLQLERFLERLFYDRIRGAVVAMGALLTFLLVVWRLSPGEIRLAGDLRGAEVLVNGTPAREARVTVWPARRVTVTVRRAGRPDVVLEQAVSPLSHAVVKIEAPADPAPARPRDTIWEAAGSAGQGNVLLVCDADGDRFPDLLCASPGSAEARSGKDGRLLWKRELDGPAGLLAADLDGDCETDIAIAGGGRLLVLEAATGRAARSLEVPDLGAAILATDVDGDGIADLVASTADELIAFRGADLAPFWRRPGGDWKRICRDGPGRTLAWGGGRLACLDTRTGRSAWEASGIGALPPVALDVDRDGMADVVTSFDGGAICALSGKDGSILWRGPADGFEPAGAVAGDLDGDGRAEIVVAGLRGLRILNAATGNAAGPGLILAAGGSSAPLLADLDGDGRPEILAAGPDGAEAFRADGRTCRSFGCDRGDVRPALADFNGDGRLDLLTLSSRTRGLCVFTAQAMPSPAPALWPGPQVCDSTEAADLGREEALRVRIVDANASGWPGQALAAARTGSTAWDAAQCVLAARALGDVPAVCAAAAEARARGARRLDIALAEAAAASGDAGLPALVAALESLPARSLLSTSPGSPREAALCRAAATLAFAHCRAAHRFERSVLVFAPACRWSRTHPGAFASDPWDAAAAAADLAPDAATACLALARIADSLGKPAEADALLERCAQAARRLAQEGDPESARSVARDVLDFASPEVQRGKLGDVLRGLLKAGD